jgi:hypothetical protein
VGLGDLGLVEEVRIGAHPGTVTLPDLCGDGTLGAPSGYGPTPPSSQLLEKFDGQWGLLGQDRCYVTAVSVSLRLNPSETTPGSAEFLALRKAFLVWSRLAQEWAAAWSGEPLLDFDSSRDVALHIPVGDKTLIARTPRGRTVIGGTTPLSRAQVVGVLGHASRGERLPVEYRMLLAASDAELGGDLRKAVIDATTGAEVALTLDARDRLAVRGVEPRAIEKELGRVNGLMRAYQLCKREGGSPGVGRKTLQDRLAAVRNRAAHGGENPTPHEAADAIRHARKVVSALRRLPEL